MKRLLLALVVCLPVAPALSFNDDVAMCQKINTTDPQPVEANVVKQDGLFRFHHYSDVDRAGQQYRYHNFIKNEQEQKYLPVEWERARVAFTRLKPKGCGGNKFNSGIEFKEVTSDIKYGNASEHTEKAQLYVLAEDKKEHQADATEFDSSIFAEINQGVVNVAFRTRYEKSTFSYTVTNKGPEDVYFKVDAIKKAWDAIGEKNWKAQSDWESVTSNRSIFRIKRDAKQTAFVAALLTKPQKLIETTATMQLFRDSDGKEVLAVGQVTILLPK